MTFLDRADAGRALAAAVAGRWEDAVVLGLPRGGVPVAAEVAVALPAPLDVFVVRKLGVPAHPELAMGAIATGGVRVLNDAVLSRYGIAPYIVDEVAASELRELQRREVAYRGGRPAVDVAGRTAVVVDDGLATGATVHAAVLAVRAAGPARVVVAVPVGSPEACRRLAEVADEVVCPHAPRDFRAVGEHYRDFTQTTDGEVRAALQRHG